MTHLLNGKVFQTAVRVNDSVYSIDTIEYEGKLWLVPEWLERHERKALIPSRIIRVDNLRYQKTADMVFDFVLNDELPKAVLDGHATFGFEIRVKPKILFLARDLNNLN